MKTVVLFHSAYGLRPAVLRFAEELRQDGHVVHTPDLYDGATFETLVPAASKRDEIGIPHLIARAEASVEPLPPDLVYAGFSMGTGAAELLAATRPGARGAILIAGGLTPADLGVAWPATVPVQIHHARGDALVNEANLATLARDVKAAGARAELHVYDGGGHLFFDEGLPDFDAGSAKAMLARVRGFLSELP